MDFNALSLGAPSSFQKAMIKICKPILHHALVYIDDILLLSKDEPSQKVLLQYLKNKVRKPEWMPYHAMAMELIKEFELRPRTKEKERQGRRISQVSSLLWYESISFDIASPGAGQELTVAV